ncbi:MAG: chemotaxis response regulator protein-glutamate methylesterase [Geminicoccaceae bacterium]|nr:chemotaxis response regulator protein-glutamate methylesterase [Geminicoccaceae bacterium]
MAIRVLVIDDSSMMRQMLATLLGEDPGIEVVGAARDPYQARDMIKQLSPDVLTLDIEMPRMDGLEFLEKLMRLRPMPVVMVSSLTAKGAEATLQALELGAADFVTKPALGLAGGIAKLADEIRRKVRLAAGNRVRLRVSPKKPAHPGVRRGEVSTEKIVAIGASTGGVQVIREIIEAMPASAAAILVTQHMPAEFTDRFARRMDRDVAMKVVEARDGDRVLPGHVHIAPGGRHLELARSGANYVCRVHDGEPVSGHRPSVDVLFRSVALTAGGNSIGVILTGMGSDGAKGLLAMREAGASTIGQDEASCTVYGMPRVANEIGAVAEEMPVERIADRILALTGGGLQAVRV